MSSSAVAMAAASPVAASPAATASTSASLVSSITPVRAGSGKAHSKRGRPESSEKSGHKSKKDRVSANPSPSSLAKISQSQLANKISGPSDSNVKDFSKAARKGATQQEFLLIRKDVGTDLTKEEHDIVDAAISGWWTGTARELTGDLGLAFYTKGKSYITVRDNTAMLAVKEQVRKIPNFNLIALRPKECARKAIYGVLLPEALGSNQAMVEKKIVSELSYWAAKTNPGKPHNIEVCYAGSVPTKMPKKRFYSFKISEDAEKLLISMGSQIALRRDIPDPVRFHLRRKAFRIASVEELNADLARHSLGEDEMESDPVIEGLLVEIDSAHRESTTGEEVTH